MDFVELIAEGESASIEGWDFSWFEGRATEERPTWGYATLLAERLSAVSSALDIQTGGGEVFAWALEHAARRPEQLAATESWQPNLDIASRRLGPLGATVSYAVDDAQLPFPDHAFEFVMSRHPVVTVWPEIARVLTPGGRYFSQQIGAGSHRELIDFMMGPQEVSQARSVARAEDAAEAAGLELVDLRQQSLRTVFYDVGAVVHFLRKVLWTVPNFTVEAYRPRLQAMHEHICSQGAFVSHAERFLIEASAPPN